MTHCTQHNCCGGVDYTDSVFRLSQIFGPSLTPEIFAKISGTVFEKMGFKILGVWHILEFAPLGGLSSPTWPLEILGLETLMKMVLVRGGSPPIWGRYGVWPVCTLVHFFSKFLPVILEISSWSIVPTAYYRFWNFKENLIHVTQINFVQSWEKTRKVTFWGAKGENIPSPAAVTMG